MRVIRDVFPLFVTSSGNKYVFITSHLTKQEWYQYDIHNSILITTTCPTKTPLISEDHELLLQSVFDGIRINSPPSDSVFASIIDTLSTETQTALMISSMVSGSPIVVEAIRLLYDKNIPPLDATTRKSIDGEYRLFLQKRFAANTSIQLACLQAIVHRMEVIASQYSTYWKTSCKDAVEALDQLSSLVVANQFFTLFDDPSNETARVLALRTM